MSNVTITKTPKQAVTEVFPEAKSIKLHDGSYQIYNYGQKGPSVLGMGSNANTAWKDAEALLSKPSEEAAPKEDSSLFLPMYMPKNQSSEPKISTISAKEKAKRRAKAKDARKARKKQRRRAA